MPPLPSQRGLGEERGRGGGEAGQGRSCPWGLRESPSLPPPPTSPPAGPLMLAAFPQVFPVCPEPWQAGHRLGGDS